METKMSKIEELLWFVFIILFSGLIAWIAFNPFVDFLSSKTKVEETYKSKPAPVQQIPAPINEGMPCDDTDCLYELPEQVI